MFGLLYDDVCASLPWQNTVNRQFFGIWSRSPFHLTNSLHVNSNATLWVEYWNQIIMWRLFRTAPLTPINHVCCQKGFGHVCGIRNPWITLKLFFYIDAWTIYYSRGSHGSMKKSYIRVIFPCLGKSNCNYCHKASISFIYISYNVVGAIL